MAFWRVSLSATGTHTRSNEEIAKRDSGWYFVRAYDEDDRFLDSLAFRYAPGLDDVRVEHVNDRPDGRERVRVSFSVDDDIDILADTDSLSRFPAVAPTVSPD